MFRLHIFILFFISPAIITAKLHEFSNIFSQKDVIDIESDGYKAYDKEILWVLEFDDDIWDSLKIKQGNATDKNNFKTHAGPMVKRYFETRSTVVKKDSAKFITTEKPILGQKDPKEIKSKLFKIMNKLLLRYYSLYPDLSENYSKLPLKIYFKGPFTAILIEKSILRWFLFIAPPSPLPSWFYQEHGNIVIGVTPDVVPIPNEVKLQFYPALLPLMKNLMEVVIMQTPTDLTYNNPSVDSFYK